MKNHSHAPQKVLIIGSGIGGLSTGIILAQQGFSVTVLEKNQHPGGLTRSYTREGIDCPVGVHYLGSLDRGQILRKFFDYLGVTAAIPVERMGQNGIIDRYIFGPHDRDFFNLPPGLEAYAENLRQTFPGEAEKISEIIEPIRQAGKQLHNLDLLYSEVNDFSLLDQARPFGKILDDLQCSPGLRSVLAVPSNWIGVPLSECPAFYHNMALASYVSSAWRLKGTGIDMADAFTRRLRELGGTIVTEAETERIQVTARLVTGVRLKSGEELNAGLVIAAVHPKVVLNMLPPGAVRPSYQQRISGLRDSHGIFSLHAKIDSGGHPELPYNIFKLDTDRRGDIADLQYYQIRRSGRKGVNLMSILTSGQDDLWAPWQGTKSGRRGDGYRQAKADHARRLIKKAEKLFGTFKGLKIIDTYTPLTIRDWVNSPGGSAYGVLRSADQMLAAALLNR
ncbi:MAG TPA: NAD(P)/FAD-dependent oxidoreductase, partial [Desulfobacterales bacterium]|nr:NAD(P)/FAD-dependent oxidoreductase [Desulfobacterales bacterium]